MGDNNTNFYDGSSGNIAANILPSTRWLAGYDKGKAEAKSIIANLSAGETIKFITNSMGAAYQRGFSNALMTEVLNRKLSNIEEQKSTINKINKIYDNIESYFDSPILYNSEDFTGMVNALKFQKQVLAGLTLEYKRLDAITISIVVDLEPFQETERDPNAEEHYYVLSDKTDYGGEGWLSVVAGIDPVTGATDASTKNGESIMTGHHSSWVNPSDLPKPNP